MDSLWSFYYWIDDFAGHFGTVVILGAMLAPSVAAGIVPLCGHEDKSGARTVDSARRKKNAPTAMPMN
jgi:hypothetical protein